jgi:hypothetical protein
MRQIRGIPGVPEPEAEGCEESLPSALDNGPEIVLDVEMTRTPLPLFHYISCTIDRGDSHLSHL